MLTDRIIRTINTYSMLEGCTHITAALSGGADSVCLLRILNEICPLFHISLDAIHVNHCIRGEESDRDEEFCRNLCKKIDIPFKAVKYNVPEYAKTNKISLEEAARNVRYRIFSEHSQSGWKIATAHTSSDNAETILINLVRGTGLKGLSGIPPVRDNFIRPLIESTRSDVEEYLQSINQDFITDSTNLTLDYTRNKIRHMVIPELLKINSGFFSTISNESKIISEENEYLENKAAEAFQNCCQENKLIGLSKYDSVIVKRCIMKFLKRENIPVNSQRINAIENIVYNEGKINVSAKTFLICKKDVLFINRSENKYEELSVPLKMGVNTLFPEKKKFIVYKNDSGNVLLDFDKIKGKMILRNRRFGDKIRLAGRSFNSSVKKLINEKIPAYERPYLHFIEDEEGLIFAEGIGISDRVKVTDKTKMILSFSIEDKIQKEK